MPRNRIIYNVQDAFIGSLPDEKDPIITGYEGGQVLQRINGIQSFNYDVSPTTNNSSIFGKTSYLEKTRTEPVQIGVNFNYISNGVNNELRMGLSVNTEKVPNYLALKNIAHDIGLSDAVSGQNLYLIINSKENDIHRTRDTDYPDSLISGGSFTKGDIIDPYSRDYSVLIFQNCHMTDYKTSLGIGKLATTDVSFNADNMIGYGPGAIEWGYNNIYTSDFNAGTDGWLPSSVTYDHFEEHQHYDTPNIHFWAGVNNQGHYIERTMLTVGKKYKVSGKVWIESNSPSLDSVRVFADPQSSIPLHIIDDYDQWVSFETEFTAADEDLRFWGFVGNDHVWVGAGSAPYDSFYVADIVVTEFNEKGIDIPYLDLKKGEVTNTVASVYTSDFNAGPDGWTAASASHFEYHDGLHDFGGYGSLHLRADTGGGTHYMKRDMLTVGKKYKVTGKVWINGANPILDVVYVSHGLSPWNNPSQLVLDTITDHNQWVSFDVTFTAVDDAGAGSLTFFGLSEDSAGGYNWSSAGTTPYDDFFVADIVVTEVKEFIIPSSFSRDNLCQEDKNLLIAPANISVDIQMKKENEDAIDYHNDHVQGANISFSLNRQDVTYVGHKMYGSHPVQLPIEVKLDLELLRKSSSLGSFIENTKVDEQYNVVITCKDEASNPVIKYIVSGAVLDTVNHSSELGQNNLSSLSFSTSMDLDRPERTTGGLFVSGTIDSVCSAILAEGGESLTTDDGETIIYGTAFYPRY